MKKKKNNLSSPGLDPAFYVKGPGLQGERLLGVYRGMLFQNKPSTHSIQCIPVFMPFKFVVRCFYVLRFSISLLLHYFIYNFPFAFHVLALQSQLIINSPLAANLVIFELCSKMSFTDSAPLTPSLFSDKSFKKSNIIKNINI